MSFIEDQYIHSSLDSFVLRKDFKGLLAYLKSLSKEGLQRELLFSGFTISGRFNEWIDRNEQRLIKCCQLGLTPKQEVENILLLLDETKPFKTLAFKADTNLKPKLNTVVYYIYKHKKFFVVSFLDQETNLPKAAIYESDDVYRHFRERTWVLIQTGLISHY